MLDAAHLPDDIAALKAMLLASEARVAHLSAELSTRTAEIEHLKLVLAKLRRMQFGRRFEKLDLQIEQLELKLEDLEAEAAVAEAQAPIKMAPRRKAERKPLPAHLPREERVLRPNLDACPDCGGKLKTLGEDVSEQLEYVPASFRVIRHVRPKLACARCDRIVQALAVSRPIERGLPGPGLLAHVLVAKYADHVPLYHQSVIYAREGVELERSLLASWVGAASALLRPLSEALRRHVFAATKLHADDTPLPVLALGNGKTRTARLWSYVRDDRASGATEPPAVWFTYSPDRKGEHPQAHLADFTGVLQADAYAGFNAIYESGRVVEAACWAHARRKFYDLHTARSSALTAGPLRRIGGLYAIEEAIRGKPPDEPLLYGRGGPGRCSRTWNAGCKPRSLRCRGNPIRHSDPLRAQAVAGPDPLYRRWPHRDRQLGRRAGIAWRCAWPPQFPVCRRRQRRRTRGHNVRFDWHGQAQWHRPRGLAASCAGAHRRTPCQPGARLPALELRGPTGG
jgi:transposase